MIEDAASVASPAPCIVHSLLCTCDPFLAFALLTAIIMIIISFPGRSAFVAFEGPRKGDPVVHEEGLEPVQACVVPYAVPYAVTYEVGGVT